MLQEFNSMTAQKREVGRLAIKLRQSKPPLVQLIQSVRTFNLSRQQLSPETDAEIRQNPSGFNGTDVEFEFNVRGHLKTSQLGSPQNQPP